jgi:glycosyltransferase involved in cell wall biosynthesis
MPEPIVSVVLPFFRNPLVVEAVRSILSQTFRDLELIAIDDASGNGVAELLKEIDDPRLVLVVREENGGENQTRNHGVSLARGKYIAFQDHDDVSYPDRLRIQVEHLESHSRLLGIGTACHYGASKELHTSPTTMREMWWSMIFNNHVMFPTVMVRADVAKRHPFGGLVATEDYRWLYNVMQEGDFVNIPDVTFHYRMQATSLSMAKAELQMTNLDLYRAKFAEASGTVCSVDDVRLLRWLGTPRSESWALSELVAAKTLLVRLVDGFQRTRPGDPRLVRADALGRLRFASTVSAACGWPVWSNWNALRREWGWRHSWSGLRLVLKCLAASRLEKTEA